MTRGRTVSGTFFRGVREDADLSRAASIVGSWTIYRSIAEQFAGKGGAVLKTKKLRTHPSSTEEREAALGEYVATSAGSVEIVRGR